MVKIAGKKGMSRCRPIEEAYWTIRQDLEIMESQISEGSHFPAFDEKLNQLEEILDACLVTLIHLKKHEFQLLKGAGLSLSEYLRIKERLAQDYEKSKIDLNALGILWSTKGNDWQYHGDFLPQDNRFADDGKSNNWLLPSFEKVVEGLTPEQLKMFLEMEEWGVEPRLQITPIDLKLETLQTFLLAGASKFGHSDLLDKVEIMSDVAERDLYYDVKDLNNVQGDEIQIEGGVLKWPWIGANRGYVLDIVSTKPWLLSELKLSSKQAGVSRPRSTFPTSAKVAAETFKYLRPKGYSFLSYETTMIGRWHEIRSIEGIPRNQELQMLNLGSMTKNPEYIPFTFFDGRRLGLGNYSTQSLRRTMWVPFSIRLSPVYE